MKTTRKKMVKIDSATLLDAAQCLDDCLIRIYPEEFGKKYQEEAAERFGANGGTIARIATVADALRKIAGLKI
jgi:hypothetical protein